MSKEEHYKHRVLKYGMGHTRRDRILALAEGSGMRVLDVGCASGVLGGLIRARGNWVGGVELSEVASADAKRSLDRVWSFDIEGQWPEELRRGDLDIVIFGEILEHVFDPVRVLAWAHQALKPGGSVIITTPNFMTWTNRLRFLIGDFAYQSEGMFDFGHIRWFTYRYLKDVLKESGFTMADERHIVFPGKLTAVLKRWPSLFAWQFVARARKHDLPS